MKRTTISLTEETDLLLRREAERRQTSLSEVVRDLVYNGLEVRQHGLRSIPWAGMIDDPEMAPARDLDQELETSWADDLDRDRR